MEITARSRHRLVSFWQKTRRRGLEHIWVGEYIAFARISNPMPT